MARVFLTDETYNAATDGSEINGSAGTEQVNVFAGTNDLDILGQVERVDLPGDIADFTFSSFGNSVTILDGSGNVVAAVSGADGKQLVFGDGSVDVAYDAGTGDLTVGGETVGSTAGPITPAAGEIDATTTSETADGGTGGPTPPTSGTTLTADVDDLPGTAGADSFTGPLTVAGTQTLNSFDSIDGLGGTDELKATLNTAGFIDPTIENVENLFFRSVSGNSFVNFVDIDGFEQIWTNMSESYLQVYNVDGMATLGAIGGNGSVFDVFYAGGSVTAAEVQAIVLDGADAGIFTSAGGITTDYDISNTGDSELTMGQLGAGTITDLVISGDGSLDVTTAITAGTIDASTATADLDLELAGGANFASGVTERTVTLGQGDDVLDASAFDLDTAAEGSFDGGDGSDTFIVDATSTDLVANVLDKVSNFEVLNLDGLASTISANVLSNVGFGEFILTDAGAGNPGTPGVVNSISATSDISMVNTDNATDYADFNLAAGVEDLDLTLSNEFVGGSIFDIYTDAVNLNVDFVENEDSTGATLFITPGSDVETLTVTGVEDVTFDGSVVGTLSEVNASALDGDADITVADDVTVSTGGGDDTLTFDEDNSVTAGAGEDLFVVNQISATSAFSTIEDFVLADDTIEFGAGNRAVSDDDAGTAVNVIAEGDLGLLPGQTATFTTYLNAASNAGATTISGFEFSGNTYLVDSGAAPSNYAPVDDYLVELSGTSVPLDDMFYA